MGYNGGTGVRVGGFVEEETSRARHGGPSTHEEMCAVKKGSAGRRGWYRVVEWGESVGRRGGGEQGQRQPKQPSA